MPFRHDKLNYFLRGYIECALWSSTGDDDEPLDKDHDSSDLAPEALASMTEDCRQFEADNADDLALADRGHGEWSSAELNGHDFWLTRNRHGAGFWDRGYPADLGKRLTDAAHAWGSSDLYIGDDGKLYVS